MDRTGLQRPKRNRKRKIIVILALAAAAGAAGFVYWRHQQQATLAVDDVQPVYEQVIRTDVENLYNASGKIMSGQESAMNSKAQSTSTDTGYIVNQVYVKVGDSVKKGDLLFTVDTSELESEISLNEQKLALQRQLNNIDAAAAQRKVTEAADTSAQQYDDLTRKLGDAADDTNEQLQDVVKYQQDYDHWSAEEARLQAAYDAAKADYDNLVDDFS